MCCKTAKKKQKLTQHKTSWARFNDSELTFVLYMAHFQIETFAGYFHSLRAVLHTAWKAVLTIHNRGTLNHLKHKNGKKKENGQHHTVYKYSACSQIKTTKKQHERTQKHYGVNGGSLYMRHGGNKLDAFSQLPLKKWAFVCRWIPTSSTSILAITCIKQCIKCPWFSDFLSLIAIKHLWYYSHTWKIVAEIFIKNVHGRKLATFHEP